MRTIALIIATLFLYLIIKHWYSKSNSSQVKATLRKTGFFAIILLAGLLVITGKLHWIFALLSGLLPFAQKALTAWRTISYFKKAAGSTDQQKFSKVETQFFRMSLDHNTGDIKGEILQGRFIDRKIEELNLNDLIKLSYECRTQSDEKSTALLETYLDRKYPKWRAHQNQTESNSATSLTVDESFEILGLTSQASRQEIIDAHKKLIQKLHPDRGSPTYFATKLNQAKQVLLKERI